ncbi:MAG: hypothetical protein ACXAHE_20310 [Roseburia sp. 1XD42-69]|jgi:hypothetical protein
MYTYSYFVKLNYEYCDGSSFPRNITYDYQDYLFQDEEYNANIKILEDFKLEISDIIAENDDMGFSLVNKCIDKVCKVVTILLQFQNYDNRENMPNLTYLPANIKKLKRERFDVEKYHKKDNKVWVRDYIGLSDGIAGMKITQGLDLSDFDKVYHSFNNEDSLDVGETIYRAALSKNIESRFFQLFTIIEAIETKYNDDAEISSKMLQGENFEKLEKAVLDGLDKLSLSQEYNKRIKSRLLQIIKTATIETRAEKLSTIIQTKYDIHSVKKGLIKYEITTEKMQEFISARNKLFHGSHSNEKKRNKLVQSTNELQELCLNILNSKI